MHVVKKGVAHPLNANSIPMGYIAKCTRGFYGKKNMMSKPFLKINDHIIEFDTEQDKQDFLDNLLDLLSKHGYIANSVNYSLFEPFSETITMVGKAK
jgi:ubiquitin C-terminal hydrolase